MTPSHDAILRLAGAYVIGTLRGAARARFETLLDRDDFAQAQVAYWQNRLAPLDRAIEPIAPPPRAWRGIQQRLGFKTAQTAPRERVWRAVAASLALLCVVLSGVLVLRSNEPAPVAIAVLQAQDGKPAWLLRVEAGGTLRVESLAPAPLDAASDYELWILPKGGTSVRSLGVVPARPGSVVTVRASDAVPGAELLITREPAGGAPKGKPTSAPIFRAALQRV